MNVEAAVMRVPYSDAYRQFEAYRSLVKDTPKRATKDDVSLYRALWQITRGQKVIDVLKAITDGGVNEQGLPRLAVGRAHWPMTHCWTNEGRVVFSRERKPWGYLGINRAVRAGVSVRVHQENPRGFADLRGVAQTPMIPARHRPKGNISGYHILWEAEWQRVPPGDPLLLRHIDGPFYVVLAQWDLTPLEQAVLRQKL